MLHMYAAAIVVAAAPQSPSPFKVYSAAITMPASTHVSPRPSPSPTLPHGYGSPAVAGRTAPSTGGPIPLACSAITLVFSRTSVPVTDYAARTGTANTSMIFTSIQRSASECDVTFLTSDDPATVRASTYGSDGWKYLWTLSNVKAMGALPGATASAAPSPSRSGSPKP